MKRRLFRLLAAVSLVLCVATIALWFTCLHKRGFKPVNIPGAGGRYAIVLMDGRIALCSVLPTSSPLPNGGLRGFATYGYLGPSPVPHWVLMLIFLALPVIWLACRRPPVPPGNCVRCGYDLRATPDRCPECGTVPEKVEVISNRPTTAKSDIRRGGKTEV